MDSEGAAPRTARAVARAELTRAVLDAAGAQLAEVGPAALSLRAVARDLGMASSAVYRYVASRDALLTALIVEAYDDVGAAAEAADASRRRTDLAGRFRAVAGSLRAWALTHPHRYALVYGSPVPGYAAPEETVAPAQRVPALILGLLAEAQAAGRTPAADGLGVTRAERAGIAPVMAVTDPPLSPAHTVRGLGAWATLLGQLSLELFGHLRNGVLDLDAHWEALVDRMVHDLGL